MSKQILLDQAALENATLGGTILGGGGGGSAEKGHKYAQIAVEYTNLKLTPIEEIDDDALLLTVSLVGAPHAKNQFMYPGYFARTVELLQKNSNVKIGGIITNENGGEATVNGWLQAALLGLPLVDAPCNGRAHPTGVMGSLNLHKDPTYITTQACVGGNPATGNYVECVYRGSIEHTSKLVRLASIEAGGLVAVARNPVPVSYAKKNCALGGVSHAIYTGQVYRKGLETSVQKAVEDTAAFLKGSVVTHGVVSDFSIETTGGFDVGYARVEDVELTFWNEYMTLDRGGERVSTFPNLIMTFDAKTGTPLPTSMMRQGLEIYVITTNSSNLCLGSAMYDKELIREVEGIVHKELVKYLTF